MIISGLLQEGLALLNGLLAHFVGGATTAYYQSSTDYEWVNLTNSTLFLTTKGNSLMGAVADIVVYGATLVDFLTQALTGATVKT